MSLSRQFSGFLSYKLLSSPSESLGGRLPLRAVITLCTVTILLSIFFGAFQWSMAGKMSASLEHLVSGSLNRLAISQKMTSAMGDAHRFTLSSALANTASEKTYCASNRIEAFKTYRGLLAQLLANRVDGAETLFHDGEFYREKSDTIFKMLDEGNLPSALDYRTTVLRPAFETWQNSQTKFGNSLLAQAENERFSAQRLFNQASFFLMGAILLPLLFGVACLIAILFLLYAQLECSSRAGAQDAWEH